MHHPTRKPTRRLRVGAVSYLNTKPLVYGLPRLAPHLDLVFDVPSRLATDLASGLLDVALIPSIEYLRDASYTIVSDACIACRGPVLSVKLLSRKPMAEVGSLALDEGSRTSAVLARLLLRQLYNLQPELMSLPIGAAPAESPADAVLLIGDRAIHARTETAFVEQWDLGDQWCRWAGRPFVFAMWVARSDTDLAGVEEALEEARDFGVEHLDEIARQEAAGVGLSPQETLEYLRDNLHFFFGTREHWGLEFFFRWACRLGLVTPGQDGVAFLGESRDNKTRYTKPETRNPKSETNSKSEIENSKHQPPMERGDAMPPMTRAVPNNTPRSPRRDIRLHDSTRPTSAFRTEPNQSGSPFRTFAFWILNLFRISRFGFRASGLATRGASE
jgi:chorismate dehydratase